MMVSSRSIDVFSLIFTITLFTETVGLGDYHYNL